MAKKTIELTIQVVPKSRAMCTTPLVSSSMKPAPRKNIWPLRTVEPGREEQDHQRKPGDNRHPPQVECGDRRLAKVEERPVVGGEPSMPVSPPRPARSQPGTGLGSPDTGGSGPKPFTAR